MQLINQPPRFDNENLQFIYKQNFKTAYT